jgi:hypothetical protein
VTALRSAAWGVSGFAAAYLLVGTLQLPTLAYHPVARTLRATSQVDGLAMRYYGDLLWACGAGALSAAAARVWSLRRPAFSPALAVASALALVVLDVAYHLSRLLAAV